ncbi:hypothetical protein ONS95_004382 [Cadophora gregata]|uniref:uncharacterized protein n=1 Tax=Cadophora gregata TaxID=51156 RepID=UPI0026DC4E35|nr:uncharacterized protein ONS95_004382 [Cadophora gregata]KAK0105224.1 hypothetical protein ONS96_004624 [Cadophora gregata f. sp. sojae]KAK0105869.1 hypothetical protein ONS95_004382 [Cadophora gregata]
MFRFILAFMLFAILRRGLRIEESWIHIRDRLQGKFSLLAFYLMLHLETSLMSERFPALAFSVSRAYHPSKLPRSRQLQRNKPNSHLFTVTAPRHTLADEAVMVMLIYTPSIMSSAYFVPILHTKPPG